MNRTLPIELPLDQIEAVCRRNPIRPLSLFGSILRDDFQPENDMDRLVEFTPGAKVGYFDLAVMEIELTEELTEIVGCQVD
ncbi:nucleotidyltransferase family protein [Leptothermofonsia sp. ETS-13]|uniref:nucleotidyltransferase family protein n=1 Tax=Leptothermofonsia sp. ETS-13 TaxID=3035696 RepID=UPI003BA0847B